MTSITKECAKIKRLIYYWRKNDYWPIFHKHFNSLNGNGNGYELS